MGVPVVGCRCEVCLGGHPKNQRLRAGVYIEIGDQHIVIDASTDFRAQCLSYNIDHLDLLLLTHAHQDHVGGIDDLRPFFFQRNDPLVAYASQETWRDLHQRFAYIFSPCPNSKTILPRFHCKTFDGERGVLDFEGEKIRYFTFEQAGMKVNGFRFGSLAYASDIKHYPATLFQDLEGVETLIISALRFTPSDLHLTVDEAIDFARKVGAKKTYLTHIAHDLDYEPVSAYLPEEVELAYDGMQIEWEIR